MISNAMSIFKMINPLNYSAIHGLDMAADHYSFSLQRGQSWIAMSSCKVVKHPDFPRGPMGGENALYSR